MIRNLNLTTSSSTAVSGHLTFNVYAANDTNCKSSVMGSLSKALVINVTALGTGAGNSDKVDIVMQNYALSANTVTLTQNGNSIVYGDGLSKGGTSKDIVLLANNTLRWGDGSGTTTTYPNALSTDPSGVFTKQ